MQSNHFGQFSEQSLLSTPRMSTSTLSISEPMATVAEAGDESTRAEWRQLGFFYDCNDADREWSFVGSRRGLLGLTKILLEYGADPRHAAVGKHEHYGPHMYLEIVTSFECGVDDYSIHGKVSDFRRLAELIELKLRFATPGATLTIGEDFSPKCEFSIALYVREDGFDPSSADPLLD